MKKIGILLRDYKSFSNNPLFAIRDDLIMFLRQYPIETICIPICFENNEFEEYERVVGQIKSCDGIILPGGQNHYEIDLKIAKFLNEANIPTLGLCLGMQIMALAFNGDIDNLPNNSHLKKDKYVHKVKINTNSTLYNIIGENILNVNSRHSEYITTTDLKIIAISDDLIIEAVEDPTKKFYIGVQWHPESITDDINSKKLFDCFINII